ncbi:MAG: lipoyl(octanoyl) transferase LipB [Venatoribacter sp.]
MIQVRHLGLLPYEPVYQDMLNYTLLRNEQSENQLWLLQHTPVFTQGQAGKPEHLLFTGDIPIVQTDRGGQVTYHGPGQLVVYLLLNLKQLGLGSRALVAAIERAIVSTLACWNITAYPRDDAPGVYVNERKIASLGLRIKHGCSFHGLALNIDMDLEPFQRINPCGYAGMQMTQMRDETTKPIHFDEVAEVLAQQLKQELLVEAKHE